MYLLGYVNPCKVINDISIRSITDHIGIQLDSAFEFLDGAFHVIVDSGCSTSATLFKEDFSCLHQLLRPIKMHEIAGNSSVTHGGTMKFQCIDAEGEVVTVKTFAYYNPTQKVRLFSPQAHFAAKPQKEGYFNISWSKTFLLMDVHEVPCHIDQHSFMPLLTCFHDADATANSIANNVQNIIDADNNNRTTTQKNLKRFHDKLGHLGFQHLKWLLSTGVFGPLGIRCSQADVLLPKCQSCLHGGQHKSPTSGNTHAQDPKTKGIFKAEQLNPSQRVFSDQYVSSKEGRNYTGRGHSQSQLSYKGGTVFCDAASSYISLHHQVGFTASETIRSKIAFEREAMSVGNVVSQYNTDNGVYTAKDFIIELEKKDQTIRLIGFGEHHQN